MAVDPQTGEPFFSPIKKESKANWVRRLGPCDEGTGKFAEAANP